MDETEEDFTLLGRQAQCIVKLLEARIAITQPSKTDQTVELPPQAARPAQAQELESILNERASSESL